MLLAAAAAADVRFSDDVIAFVGTGKIKYSEFVAAELDESSYGSDGQIEAAFHRLDFNGDGKVNDQDAKSAWTKLQPWLARHVPLSGGLFAGFTAGMR